MRWAIVIWSLMGREIRLVIEPDSTFFIISTTAVAARGVRGWDMLVWMYLLKIYVQCTY